MNPRNTDYSYEVTVDASGKIHVAVSERDELPIRAMLSAAGLAHVVREAGSDVMDIEFASNVSQGTVRTILFRYAELTS